MEQLVCLDNLLIERRLQASFGTCKIDFRVTFFEILTFLLLVIDEKQPLAILNFSIPKQG